MVVGVWMWGEVCASHPENTLEAPMPGVSGEAYTVMCVWVCVECVGI